VSGAPVVRVLGVYGVPAEQLPDDLDGFTVHLVEVVVDAPASTLDVSEFCQEDPKAPRSNWQVAYDERFLNAEGTAEEGGLAVSPCRLAFYLHLIDFARPMRTPFGPVNLPEPTPMPERLQALFVYEELD